MQPKTRSFKPGENLFHEGQPSQSLFVIKKGTVVIRKRRGSGFIDLAKVFENEVLGEVSFFDRNPRSASAIALTEVEVIEIPFDGLEKVYSTLPDYLRTIISSLAERLRRANDRIRKFEEASPEQVPDSSGEGEPLDAAAALVAAAGIEAPSGKSGK